MFLMKKNIELSIVTVVAAAIVATGVLSTLLIEQHAYALIITPGGASTAGAFASHGCARTQGSTAGNCGMTR
jgi:hypothetical protein